MKKLSFILFLILSFSSALSAQDTLRLTNTKNNKVINLVKGTSVGYTEIGKPFIKTDLIGRITDTTITIGERNVMLENITAIGPRKKGTAFLEILGSAISGYVFGYSLGNTTISSNLRTVCLISSVSLFSVTLYFTEKNNPKRLKSGWVLKK